MDRFYGLWVAVGFLILHLASADSGQIFKKQEVMITGHSCMQNNFKPYYMDAFGTDSWRRVAFPPGFSLQDLCKQQGESTSMTCSTEFWVNPHGYHDLTQFCVDYSRLTLAGRDNTFTVFGSDGDNPRKLLQRLNSDRYPAKEQYMEAVTCIEKGQVMTLTLEFKLSCADMRHRDKILRHAVQNWVYVYTQSKQTGSVYFVDGSAYHRLHRMPTPPPDGRAVGHAKVTVRSLMWEEETIRSAPDVSSLPLSIEDGNASSLCVSWSPMLNSVIPPGMKFTIIKSYPGGQENVRIFETGATLFNTLYNPKQFACYHVRYVDNLIFQVSREYFTRFGFHDGELLFELTVQAHYGIVVNPGSGDTDWSTTTRYTPYFEDNSNMGTLALAIFLPIIAVVLIVIVIAYYRRNKRQSRNQSGHASRGPAPRPLLAHTGPYHSSHHTHTAELQPMVPLQPSAPTEDRFTPGRGDNYIPPAVHIGPPPLDAGSEAPPAYTDLFPSKC